MAQAKIDRRAELINPAEPIALIEYTAKEADRIVHAELPNEQFEQLVGLVDKARRRLYGRDLEQSHVIKDAINRAMQTVKAMRGWDITSAQFEQIRRLAGLSIRPERIANLEHRKLSHLAAAIQAQVFEVMLEQSTNPAEQIVMRQELGMYEHALVHVWLEQQAYRHEKSGLLKNREAIRDRFVQMRTDFVEQAEPDEVIAVTEFDLVGLKQLNTDHTIPVVDNVIMKGIGDRLRAHFRPDDILAQLGGDEFQLVFKTKRQFLEVMIQRLHQIIESEPFMIRGRPVFIKLRSGTEVHDHTAVQKLPTNDAQIFMDAIRTHPLEAVEYVKVNKSSGHVIWTPDLIIPPQAREHMYADTLIRNSAFEIAQIRQNRGDEAAEEFIAALKQFAKDSLRKS